ncbi:MAG: trehalose-6-phosphate synthase [Candidatus Peribacteraceae bacterium]|nr:trehalose-6-phosphate synthase [Candidatus Peribacteraceae bacterium]
MRLTLRFLIPLAIVLGLIAYGVTPLADNLLTQWFVKDLELRSKLIVNALDNSIFETIDARMQTKTRIDAFFRRIMQDERLFALGFCDTEQQLRFRTEQFPDTIACEPAAEGAESRTQVVEIPNGSLHVAAFPLQGSGRVLGELVLVHDMSFVTSRSTRTQGYIMYFIAIIGAIVSVITVIIAQLSLRGWISGMRGLLGENRQHPLSPSGPPELQPFARDLRRLIRDVETDRRLRDDSQTVWTARALKELLTKELGGEEVMVISNREPYIHVRRDGKVVAQVPASGLVTALDPIMRACQGTWIAHGSGSADRETVDAQDRVQAPPDHPRYTLRRVWLSEEEERGYYFGFANEGIWPLCHIAHVRPNFRSEDWRQYIRVNEKFARAAVEEAKTEDPVILVQDYHFALLPRMLRRLLPKATIITFWHIPWPNPEEFGICPWTEEIVSGLLGSNIIGFHTRFHCNNFLETAERFLECRGDREHSTISFRGEQTAVYRYPVSVDYPVRLIRQTKSVEHARLQVREKLGIPPDRRLGLGVDRLDYTKGIVEKLRAVERLLERHPEWIGRFTFLQIAAPTRDRIDEYRKFRADVVAEAERINGRFGSDGYQPVILRVEHHEPADILQHYRAADLCFVASLHDGMNLVCKEFVAARNDERGVLILSQFTGASRELLEALLVNPYHVDQCAESLHSALTMPEEEQRDRMRNMRATIHDFNIFRWAGRMLLDAARIRQRRRFVPKNTFPTPLPVSEPSAPPAA